MRASSVRPGDRYMEKGELFYTVKSCEDQYGTVTAKVVYADPSKKTGIRYWISDSIVDLVAGPGHYSEDIQA